MRLVLTALVALTAASAAAQDGVPQDGVSVTEGDAPEEAESSTSAPIGPALLYTRELTEHDLAQKLRGDPASLGSISIGFADRGRIINAVQMPQDPAWIIERPDFSYAVRETVDGLAQAFRSVRRQFPDSAPAFGGLVKHGRSHRDHFPVRFYAPRSQEVGRRLQPMLALLPGQNLTTYVVRSGNSLGQIAARYKTTVAAIRKANQMKTESLLQLGQHLIIPLRGACTICPLPPPLAIPPRQLPPEPPASVAQSWVGGINPELSTAE